jgi:hypothetical protein
MRQAWEAVRLAYRCPCLIDIGLVSQDLFLAESGLASRCPCLTGIDPAWRPLCLLDTACHLLFVPDLRSRAHHRMGVPLIEGPS